MTATDSRLVIVGRINGIFGVKGWVKVLSFTAPRTNILSYSPWQIYINGEWQTIKVIAGRAHGKGIIAHLEGYDDRDSARRLIGYDISVNRRQLPAPGQGEYYWADLVGMGVVTVDGVYLGNVDHLMNTGANDVLVVTGERERLVPFIPDEVVIRVDTQSRTIVVAWNPEY
jgi:16S rRNA processing protein RimM